MRSDRSHRRGYSLLAPIAVALVVGLDCSVDRNGLGGGGVTPVMVGSGGSAAGAGGLGGGGTAGDAGGGGAANGGNTGSGGGGVSGTGGALPGTGGSGGASGGESGGPDDAGAPFDAPSATAGCADGTREAFTDNVRFPSIAGCAGAWSVPGLISERSMAPGCARAAGNDGSNPTGIECTVEDMCADGWHVCGGASELTVKGVSCQDAGIVPMTAQGGAMFFATRQRGTPPTGCSPGATTGSNNLHGCGNFGRVEDPGCAPPLDRQIENTACTANPPWSCSDPVSIMTEAMVVTKSAAAAGGVLCCR
jgi:hypothetical protein